MTDFNEEARRRLRAVHGEKAVPRDRDTQELIDNLRERLARAEKDAQLARQRVDELETHIRKWEGTGPRAWLCVIPAGPDDRGDFILQIGSYCGREYLGREELFDDDTWNHLPTRRNALRAMLLETRDCGPPPLLYDLIVAVLKQ